MMHGSDYAITVSLLTIFPHIKAQTLISYNPLVNQLLLLVVPAVDIFLSCGSLYLLFYKLSHFIHSLPPVAPLAFN